MGWMRVNVVNLANLGRTMVNVVTLDEMRFNRYIVAKVGKRVNEA